MTSPLGRSPAARKHFAAMMMAATPLFMSEEPRPYKRPSTMSAESGPCSQASSGPFGTVSVWPLSRRDLPPPAPRSTPTTFGLPS